jgi:5-methylcytosine-specific restriction endonuclease McrA
VTVHVRAGRAQRKAPVQRDTRVRVLAESRRAYDRRRRSNPLSPSAREYAELLRRDICSYCMGHCGQMAADHIVPLDGGGENDWTNLTAAGRPCNASKKAKHLLTWMLERRPHGTTG